MKKNKWVLFCLKMGIGFRLPRMPIIDSSLSWILSLHSSVSNLIWHSDRLILKGHSVISILHLQFLRQWFWYYFWSYLVKYWRQGHKSIDLHFLKGNGTRNTPVITDCCNNKEFLRKSQKRILIYCLKKCEQSIASWLREFSWFTIFNRTASVSKKSFF